MGAADFIKSTSNITAEALRPVDLSEEDALTAGAPVVSMPRFLGDYSLEAG